jgi:predicted GNAT family N-acyltransferase
MALLPIPGIMTENTPISIKRINTKDPLYSSERELRNSILLRPIGLPDHAWEMHDEQSWHFVAVSNNKVIGCVVLFPVEQEAHQAQLMQMAVETNNQGTGVGKLLVGALLDFCRSVGIREIICHARTEAVSFYLKLGFEIYGAPFTEVGLPHRYMRIYI